MPCGAVIVVQMLSLVKCRDIVVIVVMSCGAVIVVIVVMSCGAVIDFLIIWLLR